MKVPLWALNYDGLCWMFVNQYFTPYPATFAENVVIVQTNFLEIRLLQTHTSVVNLSLKSDSFSSVAANHRPILSWGSRSMNFKRTHT
jgi:hypothetical protein